MRRHGWAIGWMAITFLATPVVAVPIIDIGDPSDEPRPAIEAGVRILPTGPTCVPIMPIGGLEVYGAANLSIEDSPQSRYYSGVASFKQPATLVTLDVCRANDSQWTNLFNLTAWDLGKKVSVTTVDVAALGDWTRITVAAPEIDRVSWGGTSWMLQPDYIRNLLVTEKPLAPAAGNSGDTVTVAPPTPIPEPGALAVIAAAAASGTLLRRRRSRAGKRSAK